jgi:hypothetical protein
VHADGGGGAFGREAVYVALGPSAEGLAVAVLLGCSEAFDDGGSHGLDTTGNVRRLEDRFRSRTKRARQPQLPVIHSSPKSKSPYPAWAFRSGDDGTRTHDPLLAKKGLVRPGASTSVHTRRIRLSRTPPYCPGGYHGGYHEVTEMGPLLRAASTPSPPPFQED